MWWCKKSKQTLADKYRTSVNSTLRDSAADALESYVEATDTLPSWEVSRVDFMYISKSIPKPEDIQAMSEFLSNEYDLKVLHSMVDLYSGDSWTSPNAKFSISIRLYNSSRS
jgi:hypothetical protein